MGAPDEHYRLFQSVNLRVNSGYSTLKFTFTNIKRVFQESGICISLNMKVSKCFAFASSEWRFPRKL